MNKERFDERKRELQSAVTRLTEAVAQPPSDVLRVDEYAPALRSACEIIQNLGWD